MGGKHKQAQRTKNNMKPSSSGRSAEMLGSSLPKFSGFSNVKDTSFGLPYFPLASADPMDPCLDPNFQLVFKKMNKKDSTTKLKALQEFADLIKTSDADTVKLVLTCWPRLYNILVNDVDHKVREATQLAHYEVVLKAKRNLAPYLKVLIGPWFTAQYDTYPPAASAACSAFEAAFPPTKIQEVIVFCEEEILSYITDNLINQTKDTLSNTKVISAEDAEARYERALLMSLKGYTLYLTKVPSDQISRSRELNSKLVSNSNFWKLEKHKAASVKAAFFGVLSAVGQNAPFLYDNDKAAIVNVVFSNLDIHEPTVLPLVYETALLIMSNVENWWKHVNIEKLFLPKLWKVLREGGRGSAVSVYPHLLPLIYNLPPPADTNTFFPSFFENMRLGMKQKSVTASRSESVMVTNTFLECLKYCIMKQSSDVVLCEKLIRQQLFPLLEWCLIDNQASYKTVFNQTASLVQYWCRNQKEIENYSVYLKSFWTNAESFFEGILLNMESKNDIGGITEMTGKQVEFLQSLKHMAKPKKQLKVKFMGEEVDAVDEAVNAPVGCDADYFEALNNLVLKICEFYIKLINDKRIKPLIENLYNLFSDFFDANIFLHLHTKLAGSAVSLVDGVYKNILYKWLKCSYLCSKPVVDLVFLLLKFVDEQEKSLILDSLKDVSNQDCIGWCMTQALSFPHNENLIVQKWLESRLVSDFLAKIVDMELAGNCPPDWSVLLKLAFTENSSGQLFINRDAIVGTIEKLVQLLLNPEDYSQSLDTCASFAANISAVLYTDKLLLTYGTELLLALFSLSFNAHVDLETITKDTLWEVSTAWQDALISIIPNISKLELTELVEKFAEVVSTELLAAEAEQINVDHTTGVIVGFGRCLQKTVPLLTGELLLVILNQEVIDVWKNTANDLCVWSEFNKGNFCSPYKEVGVPDSVTENEIVKFFVLSHIKLKVIAANLEDALEVEEADEEENKDSEVETFIRVFDNWDELLLGLLHTVCLADSCLTNYTELKHTAIIKKNHTQMLEILKATFLKVDDVSRQHLQKLLEEYVFAQHWLWCRAASLFYTTIFLDDPEQVYRNYTKRLMTEENRLGFLHLSQEFGQYLGYEHDFGQFGYLERIIINRNLLKHAEEADVQVAEDFSRIEALKGENKQGLLILSINGKWNELQNVVEVMRYCSVLLKHQPELVTDKLWDFIVILLATWTSNLGKVKDGAENPNYDAVLMGLSELFCCVREHILRIKKENPASNLVNEWENVLSQNVNLDLFCIWYYLMEKCSSPKTLPVYYISFLQSCGKITDYLEQHHLFSLKEGFPKWTKVTQLSVSLLLHPQITVQLWGYKMLLTLVPGLIEVDSSALSCNKPHEKGFTLENFKTVLIQTQDITQTMLLEFRLGEDTCRVEPFTDSFTYTFAYLLLWDVMLMLCEKASTELRYQYSEWLQQDDFLKNLLRNIFRLMPAEALDNAESKKRACANLFLNKPALDISGTCTSDTLEHMVCWVYSSAVFQLQALVRQWWTNIDTRTSQIVDHITSVYVSPQLCSQELLDISQNETKFKNMIVKVHPSVREVVAVYTVDEAQMDLVITLPTNYPLGVPDIQCNRQIGGTSHRQWLKQLKMCILHQNGRIWDGLCLWNNNLDKKFDGVEECYICFAILHLGTYQLPRLCCQTCRKKFHSACLYKWFSTSNKSTCPICRNLF